MKERNSDWNFLNNAKNEIKVKYQDVLLRQLNETNNVE